MTNSNTDKKIGRLKAGTWGRTSGGYPQSSRHSNAKDSKRRGSKGARRVAKDELRNIREYGEHEAKKTIEKRKLRKKLEKVAPWMAKGLKETVIKKKDGGTIMVKQSFLDSLAKTHPKDHARLMKKFKNMPRPVKEGKDYSDSKKNHYELYADKNDHHKAHKEIHKAVTHKSGNPKHMFAAMKKHSKHGAEDTASREQIHGHFMKHHADKKGKTWSIKESAPGGDTDKKTMSAVNKRIEKDMKKKGIKTNWSVKEAADYLEIPEDQIDEIRRSPYYGRPSDPGGKGKSRNLTAEKNRKENLAKAANARIKATTSKQKFGEEKYPQSLLLKGNEDAAKKSKAERQDEKQRKLERAKHDTGGFRISDADAKKAKARLKKKYGKFARHFREFTLDELSKDTLHSYMTKRLSQTPPHDMDSKQIKDMRRAGKQIFKKEYSKTGKPVKDKKGKTVGLVHEQERVVESLSKLASRGLENVRTFHKTDTAKQIRKNKSTFNVKTATKKQLRQADIDSVKKKIAEHRSSPDNAYPIYKTKEYENRPSREDRQASYRQKLANKKTARKIAKATITKSVSKPTPTMHDVKDSMWGKGKHSTKKPYMEGTFKQQFEPEYTEGKQRVKNAIRAKLGLKKGPQGDWKKEMKMRHARERMIKSFRKENFVIGKDGTKKDKENYHKDMAKGYGDGPKVTSKDLDNMAKHYSKKKKIRKGPPMGVGQDSHHPQIKEDAASGRPIKKPVKKINKKDSGKDGAFVFSSPKSNVIGSYTLKSDKPKGKWIGKNLKRYPTPAYMIGQKAIAAGDSINSKIGWIFETAEYKAAMGPGSHEWGTDIGRDYFKKLTPGQDNPPEDPIKPLNIKARKPQDEKGVKVTEDKGFDLDGINSKQAEYTKEKYPVDNAVDAQWQSNVDGILTGAYEGGKITWEDVIALDKEAENITFDQEVKMGLYDPEELEANDFDGDPLNDTAILEVLSVQGRMKRRFAARRNRQKLKVARGIALRRGSTPDRIKRRATRGARLLVYKRLLRGRDRASLPPAEKARLERMITRFQPLVNRISVKLLPQIRKNEIKRMGNRGKRTATVSKKFKAATPIRGAASQKAKRYKIKKPGKYKAPKQAKIRSRIRSGGPTLKRKSQAYKAFSFSVG